MIPICPIFNHFTMRRGKGSRPTSMKLKNLCLRFVSTLMLLILTPPILSMKNQCFKIQLESIGQRLISSVWEGWRSAHTNWSSTIKPSRWSILNRSPVYCPPCADLVKNNYAIGAALKASCNRIAKTPLFAMPSSMFCNASWQLVPPFGIYVCITHDELCSWVQQLKSV